MQLQIRGVLIVNKQVLIGICKSLNSIAQGLIYNTSRPYC
jgi:hypothetical protein